MFELSFYPIADSYLLVAVAALALGGPAAAEAGAGHGDACGGGCCWRRSGRGDRAGRPGHAPPHPGLHGNEEGEGHAGLPAGRSRGACRCLDALAGKTRWEALRSCLADAAPALRELQREFEVKAYVFDRERPPGRGRRDGKIALPEKPAGQETAIGAALEDVLQQEQGKRLLGVIVLTDGGQRALPPRDLPPQTAAAYLKHQGDQLFTVVFGQSQGLGGAKDVAVTELLVNPTVFVKNELTVSGQVRIDGYVNRDIPVRVLFETSPGKMEVVAEDKVRAVGDGQIIPVKLKFIPETPGECKLTLERRPQLDELVTTNNELSTFVHVRKGGLNVLYIEGTFRVEQTFIRRALDSSHDIHVDYLRLDARVPRPGPATWRPISSRASTRSIFSATSIRPPSGKRSCATWRRR